MFASRLILSGVRRPILAAALAGLIVAVTGFYGTALPVQAAATPGVTYAHDPLGRLTGVIDPSSGVAQYVYDAAGNISAVNRFALTTLSLVEFSPGTATAGSHVTLYGSGFNATPAANRVTFNGLAGTVVSGTQTQLIVTVPSGVTTGPIVVNNASSGVAGARAFIVPPQAPGITSLSASVVTPGTSVTIAGSSFDPVTTRNQVLVNNMRAVVTAASAASLTFTVPYVATSGRVTVIDANGTTSGPDLYVAPPPYSATDIGFRSRVVLGTPTAVVISTPGQQGMVLFDGVKGHRISVGFATGATMNVNVTVYAPNGMALASSFLGAGSFLDTLSLPETGTYTIFVSPSAPGTGSIGFTVYDVPPDATAVATLNTQTTVTTTVPGQNATVTFAGTTGHRISIAFAAGTTVPVNLTLNNPDGTVNAGANGPWVGAGSFIDIITLPQTGTYSIFLNPNAATTGTDIFTVYDVPPDATLATAYGTPTSIANTVPGQNASVTWSGKAGAVVTVNVTDPNLSASVGVKNPDGTFLSNPASTVGGTTLSNLALAQTGTYSVTIDPSTTTVGSFTVTVTLVSGPAMVAGPIAAAVPVAPAAVTVSLVTAGAAGGALAAPATSSPTPAATSSPTPAASSLPTPAASSLPTPAASSLPTPAASPTAGPSSAPAAAQTSVKALPEVGLTLPPLQTGAEDWAPPAGSSPATWKTNRSHSPWEDVPPLKAPAGVTALSGRVPHINFETWVADPVRPGRFIQTSNTHVNLGDAP